MPDITMCKGKKTVDGTDYVCPHMAKCFRHTAIPDEYAQSYFTGAPFDQKVGSCDYILPNSHYKSG